MTSQKTVRSYTLDQFITHIYKAPYTNKRDWILSFVTGKDVLDLGIIDHNLEYALNNPERWLHGHIKNHSASLIGVDILADEIRELRKLGYEAHLADAQSLRLDQKFDVVVCGDLIEHVTNPGALLETIDYHLRDDGIGLVTTPNPFSVNRFFNILVDSWTAINREHVSWFCPQTMFQLVDRSPLVIDSFYWLKTDYPALTKRPFWGHIFNALAPHIIRLRQTLRDDYGVVLKKRTDLSKN